MSRGTDWIRVWLENVRPFCCAFPSLFPSSTREIPAVFIVFLGEASDRYSNDFILRIIDGVERHRANRQLFTQTARGADAPLPD